jgi:Ion transport protein
VFQIVTAESWSTYMYNLMDVDWPFFAAIYTIFIVVVGSFFLMNLILAVIIQAFIQITKRELEDDVRKLNNQELKSSDAALAEILDHIE